MHIQKALALPPVSEPWSIRLDVLKAFEGCPQTLVVQPRASENTTGLKEGIGQRNREVGGVTAGGRVETLAQAICVGLEQLHVCLAGRQATEIGCKAFKAVIAGRDYNRGMCINHQTDLGK